MLYAAVGSRENKQPDGAPSRSSRDVCWAAERNRATAVPLLASGNHRAPPRLRLGRRGTVSRERNHATTDSRRYKVVLPIRVYGGPSPVSAQRSTLRTLRCSWAASSALVRYSSRMVFPFALSSISVSNRKGRAAPSGAYTASAWLVVVVGIYSKDSKTAFRRLICLATLSVLKSKSSNDSSLCVARL